MYRRKMVATGKSPDDLDSILFEGPVAGQDGKRFGDGLGYQKAIEGIAVVVGKRFELEDVRVTDGEELHAVGVHLVPDIGNRRADGVELAGLDLDGDLPEGDEAEDKLISTGAENFFSLCELRWSLRIGPRSKVCVSTSTLIYDGSFSLNSTQAVYQT